jgi:flagellar basal body-associated protein FliL
VEPPYENGKEGKRSEDQRKLNHQIILIVVVVIIAAVFMFLFVIAPKALDLHLLPFDLFGNSEETAGGGSEADDKDAAGAEGESAAKIESVSIEISSLTFNSGDKEVLEENGLLTVGAGTIIRLKAVVTPAEAAAAASYVWNISGGEALVNPSWQKEEATLDTVSPGELIVTVRAEGNGLSFAEGTFPIRIVAPLPEEPVDTLYPFKGTVFVTKETKLGIFVRSDHVVNGETKKMNDGNKIAYIEGGNTSVELVATGNEYDEGSAGYWWYEVEVPQWYRDSATQTKNYAGKPLLGWVRADVVKEK